MSSPDPVPPPTEPAPDGASGPAPASEAPPKLLYPPIPAAPPEPRSRAIPIIISVAVALLLVAGGAALALLLRPASPAPTAEASPSTSPTRPRPSSATSWTKYTGDLQALMEPVPSGATQLPIDEFPADTPDEQQAAILWAAANPVAYGELLRESGFERGIVTRWEAGGYELTTNILQFRLPTLATQWCDDQARTIRLDNRYGHRGVLNDVEGAWGEYYSGDMEMVFVRAEFVVVMYYRADALPDRDFLFTFARRQYSRLPH